MYSFLCRPSTSGGSLTRVLARRRSAARAALVSLPWLAPLIGCDRSPPEVHAPEPELRPAAVLDVPEQPLSTLAAPVMYDLTEVLGDLEEEVPVTFGNLEERHDHPDRESLTFAYEAERSPFDAGVVGETARLSATLEYRVRAWYDPPVLPEVGVSCGTGENEPRPKAVIEVSSPLRLSRDWVLTSRARVERVAPESPEESDRCRITLLGIDVTGSVMGAARALLDDETSTIDEKVAEVDVRGSLQRIWHTLQEPHQLADDVWLLMNPVGVTRGAIDGAGTVLEIQVGLTARPRIVVGPRPTINPTDLPPLTEGTVNDEAHILIEGLARYGPATERLTRELGEYEFTFGGSRIRIRRLDLQGIGDGKVALGVTFDGSARGTVYLVGTPAIEQEMRTVHVPDLQFDVETRNLLVGGLAWLAHSNLVQFLRNRARIPIADVMALADEQLRRGINRELSDDVTVEGEVLSSHLIDVVATREALIVRAGARARASLHVHQGERRVHRDNGS